jgi:16S rRNA (guanine527-N7)-methyltransferase
MLHDAQRPPKRTPIAFDASAVRMRLAEGIDELKLSLSRAQITSLVDFLKLLHGANQIHNLTAIRDPLEMASKHVLDALSVLPYLRTPVLLDVGSGGGVPGLPLFLAGGCQRAVLIDSVGKKVRVMADIAEQLGVSEQVTAVNGRVEELKPNAAQFQGCTQIIARAFASLDVFVKLAGPMLAPGGELLAMKGVYPEAEVASLPKGWRVSERHDLRVPFVEGERCLLVLKRR